MGSGFFFADAHLGGQLLTGAPNLYLPNNQLITDCMSQHTNETHLHALMHKLQQQADLIHKGGGGKAIARQHERNKLTARERVQYLIDAGSPFMELGTFAGFDMYMEEGGCPAGGTVAGIGYIAGRQCMIVANDQTVKAGAWFPPITAIFAVGQA